MSSLSQFDFFVLKRMHSIYGNDTNEIKSHLLGYKLSYESYEELAKEFCEIDKRCDFAEIKEYLTYEIAQLQLINGYVTCVC